MVLTRVAGGWDATSWGLCCGISHVHARGPRMVRLSTSLHRLSSCFNYQLPCLRGVALSTLLVSGYRTCKTKSGLQGPRQYPHWRVIDIEVLHTARVTKPEPVLGTGSRTRSGRSPRATHMVKHNDPPHVRLVTQYSDANMPPSFTADPARPGLAGRTKTGPVWRSNTHWTVAGLR